jgi:hypothetical protein
LIQLNEKLLPGLNIPDSLLLSGYQGFLPGVVLPGREADYYLPRSAWVKMSGALPVSSANSAFMSSRETTLNLPFMILFKEQHNLSALPPAVDKNFYSSVDYCLLGCDAM